MAAAVAALVTLVVGAIVGIVIFTRQPKPQAASRPLTDAEREQAFRENRGPSLVGWGVAASVLLPAVGLIIGVVLLFKERVGPGLGCILLSVLMAGVWYSVTSAQVGVS